MYKRLKAMDRVAMGTSPHDLSIGRYEGVTDRFHGSNIVTAIIERWSA